MSTQTWVVTETRLKEHHVTCASRDLRITFTNAQTHTKAITSKRPTLRERTISSRQCIQWYMEKHGKYVNELQERILWATWGVQCVHVYGTKYLDSSLKYVDSSLKYMDSSVNILNTNHKQKHNSLFVLSLSPLLSPLSLSITLATWLEYAFVCVCLRIALKLILMLKHCYTVRYLAVQVETNEPYLALHVKLHTRQLYTRQLYTRPRALWYSIQPTQ